MKHFFIFGLVGLLMANSLLAEQKIFLGDLQPIQTKVGWANYRVFRDSIWSDDKNPTKCMVNGKVAQIGIFAHANSEIIFAIPAGVRVFEAVGAMPTPPYPSFPDNGTDMLYGTWAYEVWIDGAKAFESDPLCAYVKKQVPIRVTVPPNARQITLKTTSLGSNHCDWSIWAEPYFIKP